MHHPSSKTKCISHLADHGLPHCYKSTKVFIRYYYWYVTYTKINVLFSSFTRIESHAVEKKMAE